MASKHLRQLQNISHIRALHASVQGSVPSSNNHLLEGPFCMLSNPTLLHLLWQCRELNQLYGEPPAERTRQAGIQHPSLLIIGFVVSRHPRGLIYLKERTRLNLETNTTETGI